MSEVLARIRVRETAGIRRFLYPLTAVLDLPEFRTAGYGSLDTSGWSLTLAGNEPIPCQVDHEGRGYCIIDFAVSLEPYADETVLLKRMGPQRLLDDPLFIAKAMNATGPFVSTQKQFSLAFAYGKIHCVKYDGIEHLREPSKIELNGTEMAVCDTVFPPDRETIAARTGGALCLETLEGLRRWAYPLLEITACKSWATITYRMDQPKPQDKVIFALPFAVLSPTLTCDFGVGGYVFGKLDEKAPEIVWRTEFGEAPYARWSVATAGRKDYVGEVKTAEAFLPQRWFHLVDSDKALAVAITKVPPDCREMTVRLTNEGDVSVAFRLGEIITGPAEFGVCYHFLNDVPAVAAATNPQSILLPPVVEVLPV